MTLPVEGNSISMSQINNELHFTPTRRNSLDSLPFRNLAGKLTGSINFSDFFGKSSRQVYTKTYSSAGSVAFTVPTGTTSIITASGYGGMGSAGYTYVSGYTLVTTIKTYMFLPPYPSITTAVIDTDVYETPTTASATVPANTDRVYYVCSQTGTVEETQPCYRYESTEYTKRTDYTTVPDVYGGSTTAFGKNFTGTYGEQQQLQTFTNIAVTPGQVYNLFIATAGGYLTFSYESDTPTYTVNSGTLSSTGDITIPANIIDNTVTMIGKGAPGTTTHTPGQEYIPPTYVTSANPQVASNTVTPTCTGYPGATPENIVYYTEGTTPMVKWDCPTTVMTDPGQPEIADSNTYTVGADTIAQIGSDKEVFPGGNGGEAGELTKELTAGGAASSILHFEVPSGGTLSYSYLTE